MHQLLILGYLALLAFASQLSVTADGRLVHCILLNRTADIEKQVRAGVDGVTDDILSRCLTVKRDIADLQNQAQVPLVGRCFADVVSCPQPDPTVS